MLLSFFPPASANHPSNQFLAEKWQRKFGSGCQKQGMSRLSLLSCLKQGEAAQQRCCGRVGQICQVHKVNPIHKQSLPVPQVLQACATKGSEPGSKIRTCIR